MPRKTSTEQKASELKRLRDLRLMLGYSQRELAKEFGVDHSAVALWEVGKRSIPGPILKLMDIYQENLGMVTGPDKKSPQGMKQLSTTWLGRTLRASTTTAKLAGRLASSSLQQLVVGNLRASQIKMATQDAIAHEVAESLGEFKGLMMKLGQIISYMDFALPENVRAILSTLQDSTRPMEPAVVSKIIEQSFGELPESLFKEWSKYPFAAASIGQVHRAVLKDGTIVAVKVQYPEITKTISADLKNTAIFDNIGSILFRNQDRGAFIEELKDRLMEECDYEFEVKNLKDFQKFFANDNEILIPKVYDEYCSKTVLTTEYCEGLRFSEFNATSSQEQKNKAGEIINRMAFESIFKHRAFNCDPHPGNYLFLDDGKVMFLDFGCVRRFDKQFIDTWRTFATAVYENRKEDADKLWIKMGFVPVPDKFNFDYNFKMMRALYEPWLVDGNFKFDRHFVKSIWQWMITDSPNKYVSNIPKDWIFTNRLQWGLYAVLGELNAEFNAAKIIKNLFYPPEGAKNEILRQAHHGSGTKEVL